ncbi:MULTISPECIES: hypothetical protein [Aeromonas]|uniref:hypothetical protein n=1 Tax=Aeromonas TaxID=642 RepID=UPI001C24154B|nr:MULTISPECIES: hypothetical protein [Aeromonas]QXB98370.1 hypothetical protein I6L48_15260 [Aeromonas sp. FDAARGOS 1418]
MSNLAGRYNRKTIDVAAVHTNLQQEIIQITEDKLRLVLNEHVSSIEQSKGWISPFGILVTILVVFATSDFKKAYFEASTWEAFFMMSAVLTTIWLARSLISAWKAKSVSDLINEIKNQSDSDEGS